MITRLVRSIGRIGVTIGSAVVLLMAATAQAAAPSDFTLKAVGSAKEFTLSAAKGRFVALHFLLKTECPVCIRHTNDYVLRGPEVPGVEQVFIKPDTDADIATWARNLDAATSAGIVIYRDPDAALAKQFEIPDGYKFHGQVVHYPALVILDPTGREVFRYVGKSNSDRYSFDKFAAKMKELQQK